MKSLLLKPLHWFKRRKRWAKITMISFGIICILLFFASSIAKSYINANGQDLIGRDIHISSLNINYLTCSVSIGDIVLYEENKKDTFVYLKSGYVNLNPWALMSDEYSFSEVTLDELFVQVIQYDSTYNFTDLISDEPADPDSEPTKYALNNITIKNSSVRFLDETTGNNYPLEHLNIDIPELDWDGTSSTFDLNFRLGAKGKVALGVQIDNINNEYKLDLKTNYLDVKYAEPYLIDYFNVQDIDGFFHTDLTIGGSMVNATHIYANGKTSFSQLKIDDKKGNALFSADSVGIDIDSVNVRKNYYNIRKTYLSNPVIHASFGRTSSNIDYVMAPLYAEDSSTIEDTIAPIAAAEEAPFHFGIDETQIENAKIDYKDQSLDRPFHLVLSNLNLLAKNYSETSRSVPIDFSMNINNSGTLTGNTTLDMVNADNISMKATLRNLDLVPISPYSEYYIAAPMTQGKFNYDLEIQMTSTEMINNNNIDIRELEFGKKIDSDSAYKVPVKLAMVLLKDKNDNIQFEVPVTGNPSDPDFKLLPIIGQTFGKFFVKAAGKPFTAIAGIVGTHPEELEKLPFEYGQEELEDKQRKTLDKIAELIEKKPELKFTLIQTTNIEEEKVRIAVRDAKKNYDAVNWRTLSDKDNGFIAYLISKTGMTPESSVEEMSVKLLGGSGLEAKVHLAIQKRNEAVKQYLTSKGAPSDSYLVETIDFKNIPDEMKVPKFKIEVSSI